MAKSKKPKAKGKGKDPQEPTAPSSGSARPSSTARITVKDVLEEPPSDDSSASSEMPPESEWDEQALLLKQKIESGVFDHLLDRTPKRRKQSKGDVVDEDEEDSSSIEEVDLDDEDERSSSQGEESEEEQMDSGEEEVDSDDGSLEAPEGDASDEEAQEGDEGNEEDGSSEDEKETSNQKDDDEEDESSDEEEESHDNDDRATRLSKKNHISSKALHVVTESLQARKREWPWAETFDVVSSDPLPFDRKLLADDDDAAQEVVDVHDDLKREVAFYDMALAAVARARQLCSAAKIPFSRPEDFFAEMVKTDGTSSQVWWSLDPFVCPIVEGNHSLLTCSPARLALQTTWPR